MLRSFTYLFFLWFSFQLEMASGQPLYSASEARNTLTANFTLDEPELSSEVLQLAYKGYHQLLTSEKISNPGLLTIIDYSKSSNADRFFTIDITTGKVIYKTLVSHGKNSGNEFPSSFSDTPESLQSSIGFFITGEEYSGKHGNSLRLDGMEEGFNSHARERAIVIHGAEYVSKDFISKYGRLGRSYGCPALSNDICKSVINRLSNGSVVFIYYPDNNYLKFSPVLNSRFE